jgi:hypothetical protein
MCSLGSVGAIVPRLCPTGKRAVSACW